MEVSSGDASTTPERQLDTRSRTIPARRQCGPLQLDALKR